MYIYNILCKTLTNEILYKKIRFQCYSAVTDSFRIAKTYRMTF